MGLFTKVSKEEKEFNKLFKNVASGTFSYFKAEDIKALESYCESNDQWKGSLLLGLCYELGVGVEYNPLKANEWYENARNTAEDDDANWIAEFFTYYRSDVRNFLRERSKDTNMTERTIALRKIGYAMVATYGSNKSKFMTNDQWDNFFFSVPCEIEPNKTESDDISYTKDVLGEICRAWSFTGDEKATVKFFKHLHKDCNEKSQDYRIFLFAVMAFDEDLLPFSVEVIERSHNCELIDDAVLYMHIAMVKGGMEAAKILLEVFFQDENTGSYVAQCVGFTEKEIYDELYEITKYYTRISYIEGESLKEKYFPNEYTKEQQNLLKVTEKMVDAANQRKETTANE